MLKIIKFSLLSCVLLLCSCGSNFNIDPATNNVCPAWGCKSPPFPVYTVHIVTLTWQENDSTVQGYNIYRGSISGGPYTQINDVLQSPMTYVDEITVNNADTPVTYYYVATAVNTYGAESAFSNEVAAVIP